MSVALEFGDAVTTLKHRRDADQFGVEEREERVIYNNDKIIVPLCMDFNRGLHTFSYTATLLNTKWWEMPQSHC